MNVFLIVVILTVSFIINLFYDKLSLITKKHLSRVVPTSIFWISWFLLWRSPTSRWLWWPFPTKSGTGEPAFQLFNCEAKFQKSILTCFLLHQFFHSLSLLEFVLIWRARWKSSTFTKTNSFIQFKKSKTEMSRNVLILTLSGNTTVFLARVSLLIWFKRRIKVQLQSNNVRVGGRQAPFQLKMESRELSSEYPEDYKTHSRFQAVRTFWRNQG